MICISGTTGAARDHRVECRKLRGAARGEGCRSWHGSIFSIVGSGRAKIDRRIGGLRGRGVVIGPGIAGHTEHELGQLVAADLARPATDRPGASRNPATPPASFFEPFGSLPDPTTPQ